MPTAGVDIAMNTHLKTVKLLVKGKPAQSLESMSIRGSNIRYAWQPNSLVKLSTAWIFRKGPFEIKECVSCWT